MRVILISKSAFPHSSHLQSTNRHHNQKANRDFEQVLLISWFGFKIQQRYSLYDWRFYFSEVAAVKKRSAFW